MRSRSTNWKKKQQTLQLDIFYFHQIPFLLSYSDPLHLLVVDQLSKGEKSFQHLNKLVLDHLSLYRSEGFYINTIITDNEPSMTALKPVIHSSGARHVTGGVKANTLAKIDRSIRLIKDRVRSILHSLPYSLPLKLLPWVISFAVSRINLLNHSFSNGGQPSPRELFCGRKIDFNRDVRVAFGDYCEVFLPATDNSMSERSHSCLALCPTNNKSGSVLFYSLSSGRVIKCDRWKSLNITAEVVNSINRISKESAPTNPEFVHRGRVVDDSSTDPPPLPPIDTQSQQYQQVMNLPPIQFSTPSVVPLPPDQPIPESLPPLDTVSAESPFSDPDHEDPSSIVNSESSILPPRLRRRPPALEDYEIYNVSISDAIKDAPDLANQAISLELSQMLSKQVFHPVKRSSIRPIPSKMFLKRKIDSQGNIVKWKARLVAGGHRQHPDETVITSSPTVHHNSFMIASLIAADSTLSVATVDVTGAYLLVDMTSEVYMILNRQLSEIIITLDPSYNNFINPKGEILVKLDKALYGCVESGRLWYNEVSSHLQSLDFIQSEVDSCVFYKKEGDGTTIIIVYVDDFLISAKHRKNIDSIVENLRNKYLSINVSHGPILEYLGMQMDFSQANQVTISMENKITVILESHNISSSSVSPATDNLFRTRDIPLLPKTKQDQLRSTTAKLLYISTHVRPDILLPVNFLCSRADKFDADDELKMIRILKYLHGTAKLGITLKSEFIKPLNIDVYADASFAIHTADRRSHSGLCIQIGSSTILCKTGKQSLVTTSSTEAELVACADVIPYVEGVRKLLLELNYPIGQVVIHQDNLSTIKLINNNKPLSQRTLHIDNKYFFLREKNNLGLINIVHTPTDDMLADMFTKPINGSQFKFLRNKILNISPIDSHPPLSTLVLGHPSSHQLKGSR